MDREELVESSSSQNVNIFIASLQKRGAGKETVTVSLSDGSSFFMPLSPDNSWETGRVLSEEDLERLKEEDSYVRGKEWAASRLAVREDSSGRLMQKLQQRGYSSQVCRRILDDLSSLGFLDDARFADLWIRERLRSHPEGRSKLLAGLQQRGVGKSVAQAEINAAVGPEEEDDALQRCFDKMRSRSSLSDEKLIQRLIRRGFSYSAIKNKLDRDKYHTL